MPHYLTENGTAHQFVDRKVIQGNFIKKLHHSQAIFPPNIYLNESELFVKSIPKIGAHARTAHIGGAPLPRPHGLVQTTLCNCCN